MMTQKRIPYDSIFTVFGDVNGADKEPAIWSEKKWFYFRSDCIFHVTIWFTWILEDDSFIWQSDIL